MKPLLFLTLLITSSFCSINLQDQLLSDLFSQWKLSHRKTYSSHQEDESRFRTFIQNYLFIHQINQQQSDFTLGLNQFADLNSKEFTELYVSGYIPRQRAQSDSKSLNTEDLPDVLDWRSEGAVTAVKEQGFCGSCWAFSGVGALEGLYYINSNKLLTFSPQLFIDCSKKDHGCSGGWMSNVLEYAAVNGIETLEDYPYIANKQKCQYDASKSIRVNAGYENVTAKSANALKAALVQTPVAVGIQGNQPIFQLYKMGVLKKMCGDKLNHGVLAVGYAVINGNEAFIVKNSWGSTWGKNGYVYISTDESINNGNGACGILADACYPTN